MKLIKNLTLGGLILALAAFVTSMQAADKTEKAKTKPYTLKTCLVSDEKLGEMGDPFVFEVKGQEVKLCCKGCKKDFDKDQAKFLKKLAASEKNAKK